MRRHDQIMFSIGISEKKVYPNHDSMFAVVIIMSIGSVRFFVCIFFLYFFYFFPFHFFGFLDVNGSDGSWTGEYQQGNEYFENTEITRDPTYSSHDYVIWPTVIIVYCRAKDWRINLRKPSVVRRGGQGARPVISPRPRHGRRKHW